MRVDRSRLPPVGPDLPPRLPTVHKRQLLNGLRVWSIEHHSAPVVTLQLLMPAGAAADPDARPGLASMTADLLDEGAGERDALQLHEALARAGARLETEVGADATILSVTCLTRFFETIVDLLADIAVRPRLQTGDIDRVRQLRVQRLAQLRDHPPAVAERLVASVLFDGDPYGHVPGGTTASLAGVTAEEVLDFYRRAWRPDQATLIVAGAAPESRLFDVVSSRFGSWTSHSSAPGVGERRAESSVLPTHKRSLAIVNRPGAAQSELRVGRIGARRATPEYHALLLLNLILGGQFTSRINMNLREAKGLTYGARTSFDFRRRPGPFTVQTSVQTDGTAAALTEIFRELEAIRSTRPASEEELVRARAGLTSGYAKNFETAGQIGRAALQLALYELPDDELVAFVNRVRSTDAAAVAAVADTYCDAQDFSTMVVGDYQRIGDSLDPLQLGEPTVYASSDPFF